MWSSATNQHDNKIFVLFVFVKSLNARTAQLCNVTTLRVFFYCQVINVDDDGNELGSGVMELTESELVLHTHRRDDVRWPYLCLRRYGYDSNLFSFESGRRCQTGQGTSVK